MRAVAAVWRATTLTMRDGGADAYRQARSATAASARHDPAVEPYRALALGRSATSRDRPYVALQAFEHLAEVVERQQLVRFHGRADNYRSWVLRNLGADQEAQDASAAAWDLVGQVRDIGHAEAHSHAALDLADAALRAGDLDAAVGWLDRMVDAPTSAHVMKWRIDLRHDLLRGRWALEGGDLELAVELGERVRGEADRLGVPRYARLADALVARADLVGGEAVDLDRLEETARALANAAPLESWWLLAEIARDSGQARFRALAEQRVDALLAGSGPYADQLRTAASRVLEG
jgi:hypothetical protein